MTTTREETVISTQECSLLSNWTSFSSQSIQSIALNIFLIFSNKCFSICYRLNVFVFPNSYVANKPPMWWLLEEGPLGAD